jgi:hypothetical protein
MRLASALLVAGSLAGCVDLADDATQGGNGKADGNGSCTIPQYGDGTCQIDIACDIPDIDCYTTFDDDKAAAAWLATQMQFTPVVDPDPRFARARMLVDRAYDLFKTHVQLGSLADKRMSVVVLEGDENAFVAGDYTTHKGGWSVQVQSALLTDAYTDDQLIGIFQHELTHLQKLHFLDEVVERTRKFYLAPDGKEPIGAQMTQNAQAQDVGAEWRRAAKLAGYFTNPELGDFPYGGELGQIFYWYVTEQLGAQCAAVASVTSIVTTLEPALSELDQTLKMPPGMADQISAALAGVRACVPGNPPTLRQYLELLSPDWVTYLMPMLAPDEIALLDAPVIDAITKLVHARRAALPTIQDKLMQQTGRPWSALRFYSFEEAADDGFIRIYNAAKLDPGASLKGAFMTILKTEAQACETALAAGTPPYGANYADEHHGTCWRIGHAKQLSTASQTSTPRLVEDTTERVPHEPVQLPRRPGPVVVY